MPIKLSGLVVKGLQHLGKDVNMEITKKLIANTLKHVISCEANVPSAPDIYATNADKAKLSEYAIVLLLAEATKYGCDGSSLRTLLESFDINDDVLEELVRTYEDNRINLTLRHHRLGSDFPHITDIQWRITADVRSSTSDSSSGEVSFLLNLGRYHETRGERETVVEFVCSTEEMQLLINKLKEVERHCEKIASE
ncbi:COMM domain-containing protein 3 [Eurosta solidaginis]|uniref:COMM domain-containing protein 3 n=1 Tax=Eurosta solidaginis TaxID=178769 RepID=UPI0035313B24